MAILFNLGSRSRSPKWYGTLMSRILKGTLYALKPKALKP